MPIFVFDEEESASFEPEAPPIYTGGPRPREHIEPLICRTMPVRRTSLSINRGNCHGGTLRTCVRQSDSKSFSECKPATSHMLKL